MRHNFLLAAAMALSAIALAALPSIASAFETEPALNPLGGAEFPLPYTSVVSEGAQIYSSSSLLYFCESASGEGTVLGPHTGSGKTTLHGCRESIFNTACTSAGQESGTIVSETLTAHSVYLKPANEENPHERPGILFTPNEETGKFTEFKCVGGLVIATVKGNGLLGTVVEPGFNEATNITRVQVAASEEGQQHTETVEGEIEYSMEVSFNGGEFEKAFLNSSTETATLDEEVEAETLEETP